MKLFLSQIETQWKGLVDVDGETFKVILFPGSSTKDWEAVLETGGWVELTPDSKIELAIIRALLDYQKIEQPILHTPEEQRIAEVISKNPDLLEEIQRVLDGR